VCGILNALGPPRLITNVRQLPMDWRYNTIWFDQVDQTLVEDCDVRAFPLPDLKAKQYATLRGYRQKNGALDTFPISDKLRYLELSFSSLKRFSGIGRLRAIRRLELQHCYKLQSDAGLEEVAGTLRHLQIHYSKRLHIGSGIRSLRGIVVLRLASCGEIDDLEFLHELPQLIDFRFVNTNVRSGDLSPLLKHKRLRAVGFMDKRHYNLTAEEVGQALEKKSQVPYTELAHKGPWQTFRYLRHGRVP
jgi:hypothetical protein